MAEPELRIAYQDESLAVVDKPAGLVVHPAPSHTGPTLVDELPDRADPAILSTLHIDVLFGPANAGQVASCLYSRHGPVGKGGGSF